jgi:hypothetical protein
MSFARTQKEHAWKSPQYRFRQRQREAWEAFVRKATRTAAAEAAETDENIDEKMDEEMEKEMNDEEEEQEDDDEPEMDIDETDQATEAAPDQGTASARPKKLSRLQKACLEFCIALLDHRITR